MLCPSSELLFFFFSRLPKLLGFYKERRGVDSVQSSLWEAWHQKELICACSIRSSIRWTCIPYIPDVCVGSIVCVCVRLWNGAPFSCSVLLWYQNLVVSCLFMTTPSDPLGLPFFNLPMTHGWPPPVCGLLSFPTGIIPPSYPIPYLHHTLRISDISG